MTEMEMRRALAREDLCRLLAACYYEPEPAFAEEGLFDNLLAAARMVDETFVPHAQALGEAFRATEAQTLLLDYTRLFLGPMDILAKPYGSVWLDQEKTLMNDSTMAVLELYKEADFEMDEEFKELPDHIAAELEFLYLLIFRENEALRAGDAAQAEAMRNLKQRFLGAHLGNWIGPFTEAMRQHAQCEFYRRLADLTEVFVKQEAGQGSAH
jgi:TorA maturation chaperone TorD